MKKQQGDIIIFIGPPGSGKGSISQECTQQFGWKQLSTGNLCRAHIAQETEIGKKIDFAIKSGKLITDSLIVDMVRDWFENLDDIDSTVILDGFPRTVEQAKALNAMLQDIEAVGPIKVVRLSVSDDEVVRRLGSRLTCSNKSCQTVYSSIEGSSAAPKKPLLCDVCNTALSCRKDDQPEAIRERLENYYKHESDLLNYYSTVGQPIVELSVEKPLVAVIDEFKRQVL